MNCLKAEHLVYLWIYIIISCMCQNNTANHLDCNY